MLYTPIVRQMVAFSFSLTITCSLLLVVSAQQPFGASSGITHGSYDNILIARGGGGRGGGGRAGGGSHGGGGARAGGARGGGGARAGGALGGGGARMSRPSAGSGLSSLRSSGRSSGISRQGSPSMGRQIQQPQVGHRGASAIQGRPSQPIAGHGQHPNIGQQPTNPRINNAGQGRLPNQLPPQAGNLPNRPNIPVNPNDINVSRSVNVEGYDGGWGYHGESYPWGIGAATGLVGFTIGSMLQTLPSNSQPVTIQGQPYYESNGMYFAPQSNGSYEVVPPPTGAIEPQLPSGAKPVQVGKQTLYEVQGVYYQPTIQNGQQGYMVVTP